MKMVAFEKRFVNAEGNSREVASAAVRRLAAVHHIAARDVALAECAWVVRSNGYLVVADFVAPRWLARAVALVGHGYRLATVERVWKTAQDLGLEVISQTKSGVAPSTSSGGRPRWRVFTQTREAELCCDPYHRRSS